MGVQKIGKFDLNIKHYHNWYSDVDNDNHNEDADNDNNYGNDDDDDNSNHHHQYHQFLLAGCRVESYD